MARTLFHLLFFCTHLTVTASSDCGVPCPAKFTDYSTRATSTFICAPGTAPSAANNHCFRDDIAAYQENGRLKVIANGCPGHKYFSHIALELDHSRSGAPPSNSTTCEDASAPSPSSPYTPRFQEYQFSLPVPPRLSSEGPVTLLEAFSQEAAAYPLGVTVSGVLIVSELYNQTDNGLVAVPVGTDFDNCGGFGNIASRYHYNGAPVCLLLAMGATVPESGAQFMYENTSQAQAGHWPARGAPSPLLGFALDGFPLFGPYNASGHLQTAGEGELDECLFSRVTQRYHFTADYPFSPPCLVGHLGDFSSAQVNEGVCPGGGVDGVHCSGGTCRPHSQECEYQHCRLVKDGVWQSTVIIMCIMVVLLVVWKVLQYLDPVKWNYPVDKVILSMLPAAIYVASYQPLLKAFYGLDKSDWYNFDVDLAVVAANLNESLAVFLAITGILYTLIIAQIFIITGEKHKNVSDALSEELSGCRQVVLCLQAIHTDSEDGTQKKQKAIEVVVWYLGTLIKHWGKQDIETLLEDRKALDLLYGSLSLVGKLCEGGGANSAFNVHVGDRIVDSMNSIASAKYRRYSLEEQELPGLLWLLQFAVAAAMFLGVLLIQSGSTELNLTMCYVTTILIGMNTLVIADMDLPYCGLITIRIEPVVELYDYMDGVVHKSSTHNLARQTSAFFSSKNAHRMSFNSVQHTIGLSAKVRRHLMSGKESRVDPSLSRGTSAGDEGTAADEKYSVVESFRAEGNASPR